MNARPRKGGRGAAELSAIPEAPPEVLAAASELAERAPQPASWGNVLCGTAGWTDRTLVQSGAFYPASANAPQSRLSFYARHFPFVEVDATYYALLSADVVAHWVEWTPEQFRFDVKAHPVLTQHPIDVARLPADVRQEIEKAELGPRVYASALPQPLTLELEARFMASIEPLRAAGRLSAVLLQFPPWFASTRGNARYLEALVERLPDLPFAVEFRHPTWLLPERRERVFDLLRQLRVSFVCVDQPEGRVGGLPPIVESTSQRLSVVRFHGQNQSGWNKKGASVVERFNYLYHPSELRGWSARIRTLSQRSESVHVVFNNCVRNYAVLNAKDLAVLLNEPASNDEAG